MIEYKNLKIDDHKELARDMYIVLGHILNSMVEEVRIDDHPENDGEKMFIDLTMKDELDEETLYSALVTAISIFDSIGAMGD